MTTNPKTARIKRGKWVKLPGGRGSVQITRTGAVVFKANPPKKNPSHRKTKKRLARAQRAVRVFVKSGGTQYRTRKAARR